MDDIDSIIASVSAPAQSTQKSSVMDSKTTRTSVQPSTLKPFDLDDLSFLDDAPA
jgi:hypothetical protein